MVTSNNKKRPKKLQRYALTKGNQEKTDRIIDIIDIIAIIDIIDIIGIIEIRQIWGPVVVHDHYKSSCRS